MNLKKLIIPIATIVCALAVSSARAAVTNNFVFSATTFSQSPTNSSNGTNTSFGKIATSSHNTAQLIQELGKAVGTTFSSSAQLVLIIGNGGPSGFRVIDGGTATDVSDFMNIDTGNNDITAGIENGNTGLAFPTTTEDQIVTLQFDDTGARGGAGLQFSLQGLGTITSTDGVPNSGGTYTQSFKASIIDMTGEGSGDSVPFVASGKVSLSGKGTQTLVH